MHLARARIAAPRLPASSAILLRARAGLPTRRFLATPSETPPVAPAPAPPPRTKAWPRFLQRVGAGTLLTIILGGGAFVYITQKDKHPGEQLPLDPEKKTIVILGSGWGATSLLKTIDTEPYNVVVISPHNYFLFTPLLPSVAVGTLNPRSIIQSTRSLTRHKKRQVSVIEATATDVDPVAKTVTFQDDSEIKGQLSSTTIPYDYLVYAVGAETQTFNIPGVKEHACYMKELHDAETMQRKFMDCVETAAFPGQDIEEIKRLLHVVVVGGGPTGVELTGELHDFLEDDLRSWYPELAPHIHLTLVEALPSVLPMFSKQLIDYTVKSFNDSKIDVLTKTMVKEVTERSVILQMPDGSRKEVPCGLLIWAGGNTLRPVTTKLLAKFPTEQTNKRGIVIDEHLKMVGPSDGSIYAIGDATSSQYAPTAQVASQEGAYLARIFAQIAKRDALEAKVANLESQLAAFVPTPEATTGSASAVASTGAGAKAGAGRAEVEAELSDARRQLEGKYGKLRPFHYSHQGSLAYIGSERAIADLPFFNGNLASGGVATFLFWRSVYLSTLFSLRNRTFVVTDWLKVRIFGRDTSRD